MPKKKKAVKRATPKKKQSTKKTKKSMNRLIINSKVKAYAKTKKKIKVTTTSKKSEPGKNKKPPTKPIVPGSTLNIKQRLWCLNYLTDFNATRAYIEVYKVSPKLADSTAYRMLGNAGIQEELVKLSKTLLDAAELSPAQVLRECRRIAMSDGEGLFDDNGCVLPIKEIPVALRRCIGSYEVVEVFVTDPESGERIDTGRIVKVKIWDKNKSLDFLFKHLGLFAKDNAQKQLTLVDILAKLNIDTEV